MQHPAEFRHNPPVYEVVYAVRLGLPIRVESHGLQIFAKALKVNMPRRRRLDRTLLCKNVTERVVEFL